MEHPLPTLRKTLKMNRQELIELLLASRGRIEGEIRRLANTKGLGSSGNVREKGLQRVGAHYDEMAKELDGWMGRMVTRTAGAFFGEARTRLGVKTSVTEYSKRHAQKYLAAFAPANAPSLAGLHAQGRMKAADLSALRKTLVDTMREASLTGMTAREIQKGMRDRLMGTVEGAGLPAWKFIDKGGRKWTNGNYLNMLTRTTTARVARESYTDALVDEGFDLATIEGGGNPCPVCEAWRGRVISLTGKTPDYPTLADAEAAGVFHPNCVCEPQYADELADKEKLDAQKGMKPPETDEDREPDREPERKPVDEEPPALEQGEPEPEKPQPEPGERDRTPEEWETIERERDFAAEYRTAVDRDITSARPERLQKIEAQSEKAWTLAQNHFEASNLARIRGQDSVAAAEEVRYKKLLDESSRLFDQYTAELARYKAEQAKVQERLLFPGGEAEGEVKLIANNSSQNVDAAVEGYRFVRRLLGEGADLGKVEVGAVDPRYYGGVRAYAVGGKVYLPPGASVKPTVMAHEMGHTLGQWDRDLVQAAEDRKPAPIPARDGTIDVPARDLPVDHYCKEFLARRTAGDPEVAMETLRPGQGYEPEEKTRPDKFRHPYVGKTYDSYDNEVLSMGIQWLMEESAAFAREDPDHFNFTVRMLRLISRRRGGKPPVEAPK